MSNVIEKINKLSNQFIVDGQDSPESLKIWTKEAKEAQLYVHLLQFDGMIKFLANLQTDIENINTKLAGDRNLDESMRQYLFGEKDSKYQIIQFFKSKEKSLIDLEKRVNNELKD